MTQVPISCNTPRCMQ